MDEFFRPKMTDGNPQGITNENDAALFFHMPFLYIFLK